MLDNKLKWQFIISIFILFNLSECIKQPNVLFIMVDDMGWNDVSFNGNDQIMTPNLDAMAYQGVILKQYYSEAICTPARSSLLTGKYSMRTGMASAPLTNSEDRGIPIKERLLPSYLKELGYSTHLVGKWHVGMSRNEYLPTFRGYDSHYGVRGGFADYYTHNHVMVNPDGTQYFGLDFFDDMKPITDEPRHTIDAFTDKAINIIHNHNRSRPLFLHLAHTVPHAGNEGAPLQPTRSTQTLRNKHIAHSDRRLYADMVTNLDDSFGEIIKALEFNKMLDDTIIIFASDNGAPTVGFYRNWGVNLPLRGQKWTPWEGGVRVPAFIWHSSLKSKVWDGMFHVCDWLPTLIAAGGGEAPRDIDGINQWAELQNGLISKRNDILVSVDNVQHYAAYRYGNYKIVLGNMSNSYSPNGYYGRELLITKLATPNYYLSMYSSKVAKIMERRGRIYLPRIISNMREAIKIRQLDLKADEVPCLPTPTKGCLYNVRDDPLESHDLWNDTRQVADLLAITLLKFWNEQIPRRKFIIDPKADPARTGYVFLPWIDSGTPESMEPTPIQTLYYKESNFG